MANPKAVFFIPVTLDFHSGFLSNTRPSVLRYRVAPSGLEPERLSAQDFKSRVSADFTMEPLIFLIQPLCSSQGTITLSALLLAVCL